MSLTLNGNGTISSLANHEDITVDANGNITTVANIGIGSTAATALHLHTSNGVNSGIRIQEGASTRGNIYYDGVQALVMHGSSAPVGSDTNTLEFATGGTTPVTRMAISRDGYVTKQKHPAFRAFQNANYSHPSGVINMSTALANAGFWGTTYNTGNHFSTSTGLFTAPIAGVYSFNCGWNGNSDTGNITYFSAEFGLNGGRRSIHWFSFNKSGSSYYSAANNAADFYMNAGDTMGVLIELNKPTTLNGGASDQYGFFSGHLVG